jgi:hypothetical protein
MFFMGYKDPEDKKEYNRKYNKKRRKHLTKEHRKWCQENKTHYNEYMQDYRRINEIHSRDIDRKSHLRIKYNFSEEQYNQLLIKQENKCAICKREFIKTAYIDHNHTTGKVRGLLCNHCNLMLGHAKESSVILAEASLYLAKEDTECQ